MCLHAGALLCLSGALPWGIGQDDMAPNQPLGLLAMLLVAIAVLLSARLCAAIMIAISADQL